MDKKISVVHLGLENFEPLSRAEARAKLNIKEPAGQNGLVIGTVAELHPVKGLEYALEAIKDTSVPCTYTIIGDGELKKQLETKIASDSALESRATLAGFVTDAAKYISAFDIFLLPSLSEAFGYVLLEAGYCNVSVIATSVGGIPEIIEDMKSGILIHAKNPKEIKSSIEFLAENSAARGSLAAELNQKVRSDFSLSKMVEKTVEVYSAR